MTEMQNEGPQQEVEVSAGDKKVKIRGSDILTSIIGMFMFAGLVLFAYVLYDHKLDAKENGVALATAIDNMTVASVKLVEAQRETTCLLSLPQERREREFVSENSLCKRLAKVK